MGETDIWPYLLQKSQAFVPISSPPEHSCSSVPITRDENIFSLKFLLDNIFPFDFLVIFKLSGKSDLNIFLGKPSRFLQAR